MYRLQMSDRLVPEEEPYDKIHTDSEIFDILKVIIYYKLYLTLSINLIYLEGVSNENE